MKKISESTIRRLSMYYRSLENLMDKGIETVSSEQLAEMDGITSAQVRKDLSFFGTFGKRGLGYNVKVLKGQIGDILGLGRKWQVAIIGIGNIGRALANYEEFTRQGFNIRLLMDSNPKKIGLKIGSLIIKDSRKINELLKQMPVDIGIIAVPASAAQSVANKLVSCGIKAILNFAPISIKVPPHVQVKHENTAIEIEALSYHLVNS